MIKHYFKIAIRNLAKQKSLAFINIFGLSLGLACFSLFMLYAINEFSFDRFHSNATRIYRVYMWYDGINGNAPGGSTYLPMPLGPAMKQDLPGIENFVRMQGGWGNNFVRTNNTVSRFPLTFADASFFSVFSFKFKYGSPATALKDLHSVVLTEETTDKLFGLVNPIGKIIEIKTEERFEPFTITGVVENIPSNSSIRFAILGNFEFLATTKTGASSLNNWHRSAYQTFVKLTPGSTLPQEKKRLLAFRKKYLGDEETEARKKGWKGSELPIWYGLQPLRDIHSNIILGGVDVASTDPKTIWLLLSIASGVLLIACINFTTLAIGRSAGRAKEVGVRKVIGGTKPALVFQFLAEAIVLAVISALVGIFLVVLLLPFFNQLSDRELQFSFSQYPELFWLMTLLVLSVGILAGSYPAWVLSGFKPIEVLKTKIRLGGSIFFTKSLVTLQFVLSGGLIISTIIIMQQLHFLQSRSPGFSKENVLVVDADGMDTKKIFPLFKQEISKDPHVIGVAGAELSLGEGTGWSMSGFEYKGKHKQVYEYFVDPEYIPVMALHLLAGRNFNSNISSDTVTSVIINEAMVNDFDWTNQNAIGQSLKGYSEKLTPVVIGVVKDFNFKSFAETVKPQMFHQFSSYLPYKFFIRIKPGNPAQTIASLEKSWAKIVPGYPLKYDFLDENLARFYKSEAKWSNIVGWAGGISIFLASLGLLGLAALSVVNRTKEIGIRKVLGASVTRIIKLLSKDFVKLVLIAFLIATPLAWYFMSKWLQDYPYRITIHWWVFVVTGIATVVIAMITVGFQTFKAGIANPVKSLKTE